MRDAAEIIRDLSIAGSFLAVSLYAVKLIAAVIELVDELRRK